MLQKRQIMVLAECLAKTIYHEAQMQDPEGIVPQFVHDLNTLFLYVDLAESGPDFAERAFQLEDSFRRDFGLENSWTNEELRQHVMLVLWKETMEKASRGE